MVFFNLGHRFRTRSVLALFIIGLGLITLAGGRMASRPVAHAATVYEVGPGKPYSQLSQVAGLLQPGDTVNVYANGTTPYKGVEFKQPGSSAAPITIHGVRDSSGRRPILSDNGLISGAANIVVAFEAGYYVFDGFEITTTSTDPNQSAVVVFNPFHGPDNSTRDITIRDTYLHDCPSFGFLSNDSTSGSMLFSHVEVARCGGGLYHHSIYLTTGNDNPALQNAVVQIEYCYIHDSNGGNDIKLRSKFNKVYYNWLETQPTGGYYDLQLIGADDGTGGSASDPRNSEVVGNVFVQNDPYAAVQVGGDGTGDSYGQYRFVNNTFLTNGTGNPAITVRYTIRSLELENNVFANQTGGGVKIVVESDGPNWLDTPRPLTGKANWVAAGSTVPPEFQSTVVGAGNDPGFTSLAGFNLRPKLGSALINAGTSTPVNPPGYTFPLPFTLPTFEPPIRQIKQTADPRNTSGPVDIGAYEANTPKAPTLSLSFNPASFYAGSTTQLTYNLTNPNAVSLTGVSFNHNLPSQLKVAATPAINNTCGSGTVTAAANTSAISVSGLSLIANQSCTISLKITSTSLGSYNTATGPVSATESGAGQASNTANVVVKAQTPAAALSFGPSLILSGATTTLTYTLTNPNPVALTGLAFSDNLPAALSVANPAGVANTCNGTPTASAGAGLVSLSGGSLAANGICTLAVKITGQQLGSWYDQLESFSTTETGAITPGVNASATLRVVAPILSVAGLDANNSFRLGATKPNQAKTATLNLSNAGDPATTLTVGLGTPALSGANAGLFSITNQAAFPLSISGGQSQGVNLSCTPSATGTISATLNLVTNNLNRPNTASSYTLYCSGGYVVTKNFDDGSANTLSAVLNTQALLPGDAVVFELTGGSVITFSAGITLNIQPGVTVDGGCSSGPGVTLDGSGLSGDGLVLAGQDFVSGLKIRRFGGRQLVVQGGHNQLRCVVASKN